MEPVFNTTKLAYEYFLRANDPRLHFCSNGVAMRNGPC
ncbi:hypothetical protein OROMI_021736 [Orobanche minor]